MSLAWYRMYQKIGETSLPHAEGNSDQLDQDRSSDQWDSTCRAVSGPRCRHLP